LGHSFITNQLAQGISQVCRRGETQFEEQEQEEQTYTHGE
jgi:hypothetical protein